jgi:hypothetical protein
MSVKRFIIASAALAVAAAGAGGAIAATSSDDKQAEQSILDDAAKRLNVSPEDLRSALSAAQDAQLDQAVKDGRLTQAQADAIKAHRQADGRVLGGPGIGGPHGGPRFGRGDHGPGGGPAVVDAAASALGLKTSELTARLRAGQSIADAAKDQGRNLDDVKQAVTDAVTKQLDADVKAGRLSDAQRTAELGELSTRLDGLVNGTFGADRHGARAAGKHGRRR